MHKKQAKGARGYKREIWRRKKKYLEKGNGGWEG